MINFFSLVEKLTSSEVAQIVKIQRINSINTFLLCKNIVESILLPAAAFDIIRQTVCVKLDQPNNGAYVIYIGINGHIDYLTELFRKKQINDAETISRRQSISQLVTTLDKSLFAVKNSVSTGTTISPVSNDATAAISTPASVVQTGSSSVTSLIDDSRSKLVRTIDKWAISRRKAMKNDSIQIVDEINYSVRFSSSYDRAIVICQCQTNITLHKGTDGGYPLSNLYKHWRKSKKCDVFPRSASLGSFPSRSFTLSNNNTTDDETTEDDSGDDCISIAMTPVQTNIRSNKRGESLLTSMNDPRPPKRRRRLIDFIFSIDIYSLFLFLPMIFYLHLLFDICVEH